MQPSYLARRVQQDTFTARLALDLPLENGVSAGLALVMNEKYHYFLAVRCDDDRVRTFLERVDAGQAVEVASADLTSAGDAITLRIEFDRATCSFSYRAGSCDWMTLVADDDATIITSSVPDMSTMFLGATVGPYARTETNGRD